MNPIVGIRPYEKVNTSIIHEFKESIAEIAWLQKKHNEIIDNELSPMLIEQNLFS